jgi:tRNA threonylcarbamoyladenosine biosynthesis protein TsaE
MNQRFTDNQIPVVVRDILVPLLNSSRILAFSGAVGAGKTTLAKELLTQLGIQGLITSPTFAYVNTYKMPNGKKVHHFDLYRIESVDDFIMNGFDEYLYDLEAVCLIEWPDVIAGLLQQEPLSLSVRHIMLKHDDKDPGVRYLDLLSA